MIHSQYGHAVLEELRVQAAKVGWIEAESRAVVERGEEPRDVPTLAAGTQGDLDQLS